MSNSTRSIHVFFRNHILIIDFWLAVFGIFLHRYNSDSSNFISKNKFESNVCNWKKIPFKLCVTVFQCVLRHWGHLHDKSKKKNHLVMDCLQVHWILVSISKIEFMFYFYYIIHGNLPCLGRHSNDSATSIAT